MFLYECKLRTYSSISNKVGNSINGYREYVKREYVMRSRPTELI